ncbi:LD-carboxypeptidase [Paenibacillus sp.]|uniref:S66 peptidase family protein n=1 Tax=Paenibacillus sp. TaxID=58172 RepID=UPI002D348E2F|nr:LD-carboxypeptidase [Paenibacillus sp.]HZG85851.1 LD-carboxypeptidase [Paenibacillus sp.]
MATKPPMLRRGDTIGIVTLGSPLSAASIDAGIRRLESLGFRAVVGRHVYAAAGFLAGTDAERAADFMSMIENPAVRMILPTRGGVGVAGVLPHLDYGVIARNPKIVSGYSDITVLLNTLYRFSNLVSFHSLLLVNFAGTEPEYNFNQFYAATASTADSRTIANPEGRPLVGRVQGNVTGPIVGGNLTSLAGTLGTPYEVDTRGKILFLEETHEPINRVYRMVQQLEQAGKIRDCIGIVLGECTGCQTAYGTSYEDLIREVFVPLGKPLLTGLASGHGTYKAAIPIGAAANLNATNGTLTIVEPTVSSA